MEKRAFRIAEILRRISHADEFGIPDVIIDMLYSILINTAKEG